MFERIVYWMILVFADIVADCEKIPLLLRKPRKELCCKHLVSAILSWHELAGIVVPKTDVIGDFDTSLERRDHRRVER